MSENKTENCPAVEVENAKASAEVSYGKIVVIKRTGQDSASFELIDDSYTFGRAVDCDIRIQLMTIAEEHVKISRNEHGQAVLLKLSEEGGVIVNNSPMKEPSRLLDHNDIFTLVERSFRYEFTPEMLARHQLTQNHVLPGTIPLVLETPKKPSSLSGIVFSISELPSSPATPKTPVPASRPSLIPVASAGQSPKIAASPMGSAVVDSEITTSPKLSPKVVKMADGEVLASVTPFNIVGASSLGMSVVSSTDSHAECDKENVCEAGNMEIAFVKSDEDGLNETAETVAIEITEPVVETETECTESTESVIETEAAVTETVTETETVTVSTEVKEQESVEAEVAVVEGSVEAEATEIQESVEAACESNNVVMTEESVQVSITEESVEAVMVEESVEVELITPTSSAQVVCEDISVAPECEQAQCDTESVDIATAYMIVEDTESAVIAVDFAADMIVETAEMVIEHTEATVGTTECITESQEVAAAESTENCDSVAEEASESPIEPSVCEAEACAEAVESIAERETFESVEMPLTQEHYSHEYVAPSSPVAPAGTEMMQVTESEAENIEEPEVMENTMETSENVMERTAVETSKTVTEITAMENSTATPPSSTISSFVQAYESSEINSMEAVEESHSEQQVETAAAEVEHVNQCERVDAPESSESAIMTEIETAQPEYATTETETAEEETSVIETVDSESAESAFSVPTEAVVEQATSMSAKTEPGNNDNLEVSIEIEIPAVHIVEGAEISSVEIESVDSVPHQTGETASFEEFSTPGPLRKSTRVHLTPAALESVKKQYDQSDSPIRPRSGSRPSRERVSDDSEYEDENLTLSEPNENANNSNANANNNSEKRTSARSKKAKLDESSPVTPVRRSARARITNQK